MVFSWYAKFALLIVCGSLLGGCSGNKRISGARSVGETSTRGGQIPEDERNAIISSVVYGQKLSEDIVYLHDNVESYPLIRLTRRQLENSLQDNFKIAFDLSGTLFEYNPTETTVDLKTLNGKWFFATEKIASAAFAQNGSFGVECERSQPTDLACAETFIRAKGRLLFRRSLKDDEVARFRKVFQDSVPLGYKPALQYVFRSLLMATPFLYVVEKPGTANSQLPIEDRVDQYSVATRLALMIYDSTPDNALLQLAERGELADASKIRAVAEEMLKSPKAQRMAYKFARNWFHLDELRSMNKTGSAQMLFSKEHVDAYIRETELFVARFFSGEMNFETIYSSGQSYVNAKNAQVYNVASAVDTFNWADVPSSHAGGVLTQPSVLSLHGFEQSGSIVKRGLFLLRDILCQPVGSPPDNVNSLPSEEASPEGKKSERTRLAIHRASPACAVCHNKIDNLGFGLESFDGVGRFTAEKYGEKLTGEGLIPWDLNAGQSTRFVGPHELGKLLAGSNITKACFVRKWFQSSLGIPLTRQGEKELRELSAEFGKLGSGKDLVLDFIDTGLFTTRRFGN